MSQHTPEHDPNRWHEPHETAARDAPLEALLDEALAPAEPAAELEQRVVDAAVVVSREAELDAVGSLPLRDASPAVVGSGWTRAAAPLAMAAAVALAMLGAWALLEPAALTQPDGLAGPTDLTESSDPAGLGSIAAIEGDLRELQLAAADELHPLDERLELLALRLELTDVGAHWPTGEPLEQLGTEPLIHEWDLTWAY